MKIKPEQITLETLSDALSKSWCKDTAHLSFRERWSEKNKALGQCAATALIINKYLGGEIIRGEIVGNDISHYWNILPFGEIVDLTKSQFGGKKVEFINIEKRNSDDMLKNDDLRERYELLDKLVRITL